MNRFVLVAWLLLALVHGACAQLNALIVVATKAARPSLDPAYAGHFETILWPTAFTDEGSNRLLSLVSGMDWEGEPTDSVFRAAEGGHGFVSVNYASLKARGYTAQRAKWLGGEPVYALSRPTGIGVAAPDALLLALDDNSDTVRPIAYAGPWPARGTLVFVAESWAEAEDVATRCGGRALVVELPNPHVGAWDSFYLRGRGWPPMLGGALPLDPSTGVAGLVRARNAIKLLLHPESFQWRDGPDSKDVVWRWFPAVRQNGLILLVIGMSLLACIVGFATYSIMLEERAPLAATLLTASGLAPGVILLLGTLERRFGLDNTLGLLVLECIGLGIVLAATNGVVKRLFPGTHPLLACSIVGLGACLAGDPKWSYLSGLFGYGSSTFSPEATGALIAYLTSVVAFSRGSNAWATWLGRAAPVAILALGWFGHMAWSDDKWLVILLPIVALAAGSGWMSWPWLFILAFIPNGKSDVVRHGFALSKLGCLNDIRSVGAVNTFDYFAFAVYPGLWAFGLFLLFIRVFGGDFVARQMRLIPVTDPRMKALPWAATGLAAMGVLYPALLPSAVLVAFGALIAFFHTAVWSL